MAKSYRPGPFMVTITITALLLLGACAKPIIVSEVQPDGSLEILGPATNFARTFESGQWLVSGNIGPGMLVVTEKAGQRALKIPPGNQGISILRPVDANLLSTSYLGWSWLLEQGGATNEFHGVSILAGFYAADEDADLPAYDNLPDIVHETPANRILEIRWADSALKRGELAAHGNGALPYYVMRGGRENIGRWWQEGIDLLSLFTRLWPDRDPARTHIVFIAIQADANRQDAPAYFANMRLFR